MSSVMGGARGGDWSRDVVSVCAERLQVSRWQLFVRLSGDEDVSDLKLKTRRLTRALICARCPPVPDLSTARSRSVNHSH